MARVSIFFIPARLDNRAYWRSVVRKAALLHDVVHVLFSHAAEADLLLLEWDHERITAEIIRESEIHPILEGETSSIQPGDVIDVAYSVKDRAKHAFGFTLSPSACDRSGNWRCRHWRAAACTSIEYNDRYR